MKQGASNKRRQQLTHLERVFWIDHQIRAGRFPNTRTIAEHFEISKKTAQRTLDFMRDRWRAPLDYSAANQGWYYTQPTFALPAVELTEGDLIAILLAERLARQYRGTAIGQQVEEAFSKVLSAMTDTVSIDLNALAEAHSFEAAATSDLNPELFQRLGRAALERRRIEMTYYTAARDEWTRRRADPLHLRNHLGDWYLIAFDYLRNEVRDFNAARISELHVTGEHFTWPEGFDLESYLDSGFGMFRGSKPYEVEIEFDEYQSRWIRERRPFHPSEQREELPDGRLIIRMTVTALDGVKRFVMQYGSHAQVTRPEELRQEICAELKGGLRSYRQTRS